MNITVTTDLPPMATDATLRDLFAGMALEGCIEWERLRGVDELLDDDMPPHSQPLTPGDSIDEGDQSRRVAKSAYNIADAMLLARKESIK